MATNQKTNEEEVDLGTLFSIIGRGFSRFFNFIGKIFTGLFHLLILLLLFIRKHFVKFAVACLVGAIFGGYFQYTAQDKFGSDMILKPNFNSVRQLYNNINYYNDLVKQKDTLRLSEVFGIHIDDASSLKSFSIEPIKIEQDIVSSFDDMIVNLDTTTIKDYSFEKYQASFTDFDYKTHIVHVASTKKDIFSKLGQPIISKIVDNYYFKEVKNSANENLKRTDSILRVDLTKLDSLRQVYMRVLIEEAKKSNSGTNIDLGGDNKQSSKEIELFKSKSAMNRELNSIVMSKAQNSEIINIISDFQKTGYKIGGITHSLIFRGGLAGILLMLFFVLLRDLNKYLVNYQKNV